MGYPLPTATSYGKAGPSARGAPCSAAPAGRQPCDVVHSWARSWYSIISGSWPAHAQRCSPSCSSITPRRQQVAEQQQVIQPIGRDGVHPTPVQGAILMRDEAFGTPKRRSGERRRRLGWSRDRRAGEAGRRRLRRIETRVGKPCVASETHSCSATIAVPLPHPIDTAYGCYREAAAGSMPYFVAARTASGEVRNRISARAASGLPVLATTPAENSVTRWTSAGSGPT
jgi:hypothetical protein